MRRHLTVAAVVAALAVPTGYAQQPQEPQRAGTLRDDVTAVLVDVVVRDRRGQPVRDLSESDFEILEDGVPQKLGSFQPVFREPGTPGAAGAPKAAAPPSGATVGVGASPSDSARPIVTALVFDRLTPEARRLAVQAAQNYLGNREETPSYIGIFGVDLSLASYAPFTRNARILRQALDRLATRASASFNSADRQQQLANAERQAAASSQTADAAVAGAGAGNSGGVGTAAGAAMLAQMEADMLRDFDVMERDQQGYSTTNGLFAIIHSMSRLPGRKSLVFFSEGVQIPPAVQRLFLGVIDAANRANVSIYTMDAVGLRAESEQAKIRDRVNQAGRVGIDTGYAGDAGGGALTKSLEDNEYVLRQDPQSGLGQLAQDTGGLLFDSTNDLRQGFSRIEDDLHNYYLLGYTPTNEVYDGRFRNIEVKVKRSGVTVAARKGYFALRDPGGLPVNPWEAPALGAFAQKPLPNAFPVQAGALRFPEGSRPGLVPVVVSFRTAGLTFQPTGDGKTYSSDFAVVVRFLDQQNQMVRKVSQHYEVGGPLSGLDLAQKGEVVFYREPELPAGLYTMETVVYDAPSGKSSVRLSTVEVPRADPAGLRMSSVVLVRRAEKVSEKERRPDNPLQVGEVVLYPNLGEAVSKAAKEVAFYFAVYPAEGGPVPQATLELLLDGNAVAQLPLPLPAADRSGRIQQVGRLPVEQLAPGTYELRAVVRQGAAQVSGVTMLRLVE
ncbi:MAG TPA: VWA domain-containing protein [Vicinamibacterales bacterium]|nr:VWA domain-containing protein [Vicinamibacterales bacterium]